MNLFIKRLFDIVASIIALVILFPFLLVVAIIIKCDSKGPIFFRQERLTKNGKRFMILKFRTMVEGAENTGTGLFSYHDDPRITKLGRFLRSTSIDELPQLLNVVGGSLALVGPRPLVTYQLGDFDTLNKRYKKRFEVKAGITGLAQVKGRNDIDWDQKIEYDNTYVDLFKKQGIWLDIKIIFETFISIFQPHKAIYHKKCDESMDDLVAAKQALAEVARIAHLPDPPAEEEPPYEKQYKFAQGRR